MPTVWRPADEDIFGIDDIAAEADQPAIMRTYKNFLGRDLEERFNMETLAKNMGVEKLRTYVETKPQIPSNAFVLGLTSCTRNSKGRTTNC